MRILITGGAGCLGSNLIEHWLPQGHEILVIDNFATGKRESLPDVNGLTVVEGSVAHAELVEGCFNRFHPSHVVHSAASYKDPSDWEEDIATNIIGTVNVTRIARKHDVKRLIYFQTALCYGRPTIIPVPVNHPTTPFTSYGISKTSGEAYLLQSDLPIVSLRLANICSPRLAIGPIPTFYKRLKRGQNCFCSDTVRDFLDIADFLSVVDLLMADCSLRGIFNISTGEGHTIKDIYDAVAHYLRIESLEVPVVPPGADDVPIMVLDPSETERLMGWRAKVSFINMINKQLLWYDDHGVTDIYSHLTSAKN